MLTPFGTTERVWDVFFSDLATSANQFSGKDPLIDQPQIASIERQIRDLQATVATATMSFTSALDALEKKLQAEMSIFMAVTPITINTDADDMKIGLPDLTITVDLSNATWNTVGTHEIATVTGLVSVYISCTCTETLTGADNISYGVAGNLTFFGGSVAKTDLVAGDVWAAAATTAGRDIVGAIGAAGTGIQRATLNTLDIGYEILTNAATDGTIKFHVWWEALEPGASVVAGAGGSL